MPVNSSHRLLGCRLSHFHAACLVGIVWLSGCGGGDEYQQVTSKDVEQAEAHVDDHGHHAHAAPHGGHLIELGEHQYNAEIVLDRDNQRLVAYVLDAHAENAVPVASEQIEFTVEGGDAIVLTAEPQEGDPDGRSSRFSAEGEAIIIDDLEDLHGSLQIEIGGNTYAGEMAHSHEEHGHDGHGHDAPE